MEEAMIHAEDAITGWIESAIDGEQEIPAPSHIEDLRVVHPEFEGWPWALVKIDPAMLDETLERVNISLLIHLRSFLQPFGRSMPSGANLFLKWG